MTAGEAMRANLKKRLLALYRRERYLLTDPARTPEQNEIHHREELGAIESEVNQVYQQMRDLEKSNG